MKIVRESIDFKRMDPKRALEIGMVYQNRDPNKRLENFKKAFPEVMHPFNSSSHLHAGYEVTPEWQIVNTSLRNPKDGISLKEREKIFLDWFNQYTDFDIIEIDHSHERRYMPGLTKNPTEQYEQMINIRMRNEEDMS